MAYDIFHNYFENYSEVDPDWALVATKTVEDADGFQTEYTWYTDGDRHICIFGDTDLYSPSSCEPDAEFDDEAAAKEWFDNYTGFRDPSSLDDDLDEAPATSANLPAAKVTTAPTKIIDAENRSLRDR